MIFFQLLKEEEEGNNTFDADKKEDLGLFAIAEAKKKEKKGFVGGMFNYSSSLILCVSSFSLHLR